MIEVIADVLTTDAVRIAMGDTVDIAEWGGTRPLAGRVRRIGPAAFSRWGTGCRGMTY